MALGDVYVTTVELKNEFGIEDALDDAPLDRAIASATRWVSRHCQRDFSQADSATARTFYPKTSTLLLVDDISTDTGLVVKTDEGDDGTYETTWSSSDFQLEPLNGVRDGLTGWPYTRIRAVASKYWPVAHRIAPVQVTARWGWAAVPSEVKSATLIQAGRWYKRRYSPEGVLGGAFAELGAVRVGSMLDPDIQEMLDDYAPVVVGR